MKTAFENRTNAYTFDPAELVLVNDKQNPLYDPRIELPLDEALVRNIMFQGVIEPVVIVKQQDKPVVVDGRQRVRCALEANKRLKEQGKEPVRITAVVRRGTESDLFGVSISANENRQDDTPLGRANKCARYMAMGRSEDEAAVTFGVTKHCVQAWMKLLSCAAPVRKAVEEGKLAASAAAKLADLEPEKQIETLEELLAEVKASPGNGHTKGRPTARKVAKKTGKVSGKTKSRREIKAKMEETGLPTGFRQALRWVLGEEE